MLETALILESAERRWAETASFHPELSAAVAVQRRVVRRSVELGRTVDDSSPCRFHVTPSQVQVRLQARRPVLIGQALDVDGAGLQTVAVGFCDDLATGSSGSPAQRLRDRLERGTIDVGSLVWASLTRRQETIRTKAHHIGVSPDLLWLIGELVAGPIAYRTQHDVFARSDVATSDAVAAWHEGYCPACGSRPVFKERRERAGDSWLRCSFCGCGWTVPAHRCAYCGTGGDSFLVAAPDPHTVGRQIEMCRECGGYLKTLAVAAPTPFALLPVEDLATTDLDLGAADKGYRRLPMPMFPDAEASAPCSTPVHGVEADDEDHGPRP